jgi:uncharacterized membrane protein YoaK (UPF0700 family)
MLERARASKTPASGDGAVHPVRLVEAEPASGRDPVRVRDGLLFALSVASGAADAISWLALGKVFSAFMTGNVVFLGLRIGGAAGPAVPRAVVALLAFAVGAFVAARIVGGASRPPADVWPGGVTVALAVALVAQAAFVVLWMAVGGYPSTASGDVLIALSAIAMGIQTTAVFSLGLRAVFTTAATATVTVLMGDLTGWQQPRGERRRLASILVGLLIGVAVGAVLVRHARDWAAVFPFAVSALIVVTAASSFHGARLRGAPSAEARPRPAG